MHHLVRRTSATLGALALAAFGVVAGAQVASAAGGPIDTTTTVTADPTAPYGQDVTATVVVAPLNAGVVDGSVSVSLDGTAWTTTAPLTVQTDDDAGTTGTAHVTVPHTALAPGSHTLEATFGGATGNYHNEYQPSSDTVTFVVGDPVAWTLRYADGSKVGTTLTRSVVHATGSGQTAGASVSFMAGFHGDDEGEQIGRGTVAADGTFDVSADVIDASVVFPGSSTEFWVIVTAPQQPSLTSAKQSVAAPLLSFAITLDTPAKPERGITRVSFTTSIAQAWLDQVDDDPADMVDADDLGEGFAEEAVYLLVDGKPVDPSTIDLTDGAAGVVKGTFPAPAVGKHTAQLVVPGLEGTFADSASPVRTFTIRDRVLTPVVHHDGDVHPGDTITVTGTGVQPHATVTVVLHSTPVTLGTVKADASGAFSATVTIPASTPVGAHTVVVTAKAAGTPDVTGSTPLTVVAADPGGELAVTGSADAGLGWIAGALVLAGAGAVLLARRATRS